MCVCAHVCVSECAVVCVCLCVRVCDVWISLPKCSFLFGDSSKEVC